MLHSSDNGPGDGQSYMYVILPNLPQDIQVKIQKLDLLDNGCNKIPAINRKFDVVDQDIALAKQTVGIQDIKQMLSNDN